MTSEQHVEQYRKLAGYVISLKGFSGVTEMEAEILGWFVDRQESNPDWWERWEEHTRAGRVLYALRLYVQLAMGGAAPPDTPTNAPIISSIPELPKSKEPEHKTTLSGGVFDL